MQHDPHKYLFDMREAVRRVRQFTDGKTFDDYLRDEMLQAAVERQFEIIGEAANQLTRVSPQLAASLPDLPRMISFRNVLIHGYSSVDPVLVWGVVESDIEPLYSLLTEKLR